MNGKAPAPLNPRRPSIGAVTGHFADYGHLADASAALAASVSIPGAARGD